MNCIHQQCAAPEVSCNAQRNRQADAADGVYWINPTGTPLLAYCDMSAGAELCTEIEAEHMGHTRDGSNLTFSLRSRLQRADASCRLWAIRDSAENIPFGALQPEGGQPMDTCQALGFVSDGVLGECAYGDGDGHGSCGYGAAPFYSWSNRCTGCVLNDGTYPRFVKQGPMHLGGVITTMDGATYTTCKIR